MSQIPIGCLINRGVRLPLYFYQKDIIDINDIIFPIKIIKKIEVCNHFETQIKNLSHRSLPWFAGLEMG